MVYIKEFELVDFQTHKKTTVQFSPYFNVIVGPTRSGKSSIVRALDFFLYNNWYEDYQRIGSSKAILTGKLSNGKTVIREKGTKANKITVYTEGVKDPERFESFGTSLPSEVTSVLGVTPIDIGIKDPIFANVANQDDPLFLLYATGTDRTKVLSRLSGLHWLDYALKDLNTDRRTKSSEVQFLSDTKPQLQEKLKAFKNLDTLKEKVEVEKERAARLRKINTTLQNCRLLVVKTAQWKKDYQEMQSLRTIDFSTEISRLEKVIRIHTEIVQPLQELSRKLSTNNQSLANTRTYLQTLVTSQKSLEKDIALEMTKVPTCVTCGQEIRTKV